MPKTPLAVPAGEFGDEPITDIHSVRAELRAAVKRDDEAHVRIEKKLDDHGTILMDFSRDIGEMVGQFKKITSEPPSDEPTKSFSDRLRLVAQEEIRKREAEEALAVLTTQQDTKRKRKDWIRGIVGALIVASITAVITASLR